MTPNKIIRAKTTDEVSLQAQGANSSVSLMVTDSPIVTFYFPGYTSRSNSEACNLMLMGAPSLIARVREKQYGQINNISESN